MAERIGTRTCDRCGARAVAQMPNRQWLCKPCWYNTPTRTTEGTDKR